ncbi:di-heme enzyme [soil metagenome]
MRGQMPGPMPRRWGAAIASLALMAGDVAGAGDGAGAAPRQIPAWDWSLPAGIASPAIPADNAMTKAKVTLGRRLFYDADLSINGTLSCATCHEQRRSFTDGVAAHPGAHGAPGLRNAPSLLNVAWMRPLTWANPGLTTLEAQAAVPITGEDPVEMGMKGQEPAFARRFGANACYRKLFAAAFPLERGRIDLETIAKALAAFQRTFVSYDSGYDRAGRSGEPLPAMAARGQNLFFGTGGCASCHSGINFTDGVLHRFRADPRDAGAERATGSPQDRNQFRTPGLRNVYLTAPYLHDGRAPTINEAIGAHGISLSIGDQGAIEAFLAQLTDLSFTQNAALSPPPPRCSTHG